MNKDGWSKGGQFARYLIPVLPFLTLFAAFGTVKLVDWLTKRWSPKVRTLALTVTALALVVIPAYRIVILNRLWAQTDTRTLAKIWVEENIQEGAAIAIQWHGPELASVENPEPNSTRIYRVLKLGPFSEDNSLSSPKVECTIFSSGTLIF